MNFETLIAQSLEPLLQKPYLGVRLSPLALTAADATLLLEALPERFPLIRLAVCAPELSFKATSRTFGGSGEEVAEHATAWRNQLDIDAGERLVYISARRLGRAGGLQETLLELPEQTLRQSLETSVSAPEYGLNPQVLAGLRAARVFQTADVAPLCQFLTAVMAEPELLIEAGRLLPSLQLLSDSRLREAPEARLRLNAEWVRQAVQRESRATQHLLTGAGRLQAALRQQLLLGERTPEQVLARLDLGQLTTDELLRPRLSSELEVVEATPVRTSPELAALVRPLNPAEGVGPPINLPSTPNITLSPPDRETPSPSIPAPLSAATTVAELRSSMPITRQTEREKQASSRSPAPPPPPRRTTQQSRNVLPMRSQDSGSQDAGAPTETAPKREETASSMSAPATVAVTEPGSASSTGVLSSLQPTPAPPDIRLSPEVTEAWAAHLSSAPVIAGGEHAPGGGAGADPRQSEESSGSSPLTAKPTPAEPRPSPSLIPPSKLPASLRPLLKSLEGSLSVRCRTEKPTLRKLLAADSRSALSPLPIPSPLRALDERLLSQLTETRNSLLRALRHCCGHDEPLTALVLQPGWLLEPMVGVALAELLRCWVALQEASLRAGVAAWHANWQLEQLVIETTEEQGYLVSPLHPFWLVTHRLAAEEQSLGGAEQDPTRASLREVSERLLRGPARWLEEGFALHLEGQAGLWLFSPTPSLGEAQLKPLSQVLVLMQQLYPMLALGFRVRAEGWTAHAVLKACEQLEGQEHGLRRISLLTSEPVSIPPRLEDAEGTSRKSRLQVTLESLDTQNPLPAHLEVSADAEVSTHAETSAERELEARNIRQSWFELLGAMSLAAVQDAQRIEQAVYERKSATDEWVSRWFEQSQTTLELMRSWHALPIVSSHMASEQSTDAALDSGVDATEGASRNRESGVTEASIESLSSTPFCRLVLGEAVELRPETGWHVLLQERLPELSLMLTTRELRLPSQLLRKNIGPLLGEDERPRTSERLAQALAASQGGILQLGGEHNLSLGCRLLERTLLHEVDEGAVLALDADLLNLLSMQNGARYLYQRAVLSVAQWDAGVGLRLGFHALDTRSLAETASWLSQGLDALALAAQQLGLLLTQRTAGAQVFRAQLQHRLAEQLSPDSTLRHLLIEQLSMERPCTLSLETMCLVSRRSEPVLTDALRRASRPGIVVRLDDLQMEALMREI